MMKEILTAGDQIPEYFNVMIEITANSLPVKYEVDKKTGMLSVDRIMSTSMVYPCNYGFIPQTIAGDGDPVDVLLYSSHPIIPGSIIKSRPIGVLLTEDETGKDAKVLALPKEKIDLDLSHITSLNQMAQSFLNKIQHFFENYKDLEKEKWVKIIGWDNAEKAKNIIVESLQRWQNK